MQRTRVRAVLEVGGEEVAAAALQGAAQSEAILRVRLQALDATGRAAHMQGAQRRSRAARLDAVQEVRVLRGLASPAALEACCSACSTSASLTVQQCTGQTLAAQRALSALHQLSSSSLH